MPLDVCNNRIYGDASLGLVIKSGNNKDITISGGDLHINKNSVLNQRNLIKF